MSYKGYSPSSAHQPSSVAHPLFYSQDASKPSNAKPEPSFLSKQPGMFNSPGQLLEYVLHVATVSTKQVRAHPSVCKWCPTASLPERSQQLWLQGVERESSKLEKKKRNHCFVINHRAIANTCCHLRQVPRPDRLPS